MVFEIIFKIDNKVRKSLIEEKSSEQALFLFSSLIDCYEIEIMKIKKYKRQKVGIDKLLNFYQECY